MRLQRPADVGDPSFRTASRLPLRSVPVSSLFTDNPGASRRRYAVGGTAAVLLSEFTDPPATWSVVVFGQSSDPASRHFFDQAGRYAAGELKDAAPRAIQVRERYHPGQRARVLRAETPSR
jgi:acyl-homoserine lactone acylase PvdQ